MLSGAHQVINIDCGLTKHKTIYWAIARYVAMWGKKISRRIFGPVTENGVWQVSNNQKLMNLCRETDI
jgi:hypothetical protein